MSNSYKKYVRGCLRSPRGRRKAIINKARHGAIPPDPYDDIAHSHDVWVPLQAAKNMKRQGWDDDKIAHRLSRKFKMSFLKALDITSWIRY